MCSTNVADLFIYCREVLLGMFLKSFQDSPKCFKSRLKIVLLYLNTNLVKSSILKFLR